MKILSLDSSATSASVCLFDVEENKIIGDFFINTKLTHSQTLVPMIDSLLSNVNVQLSDIDAFAVNVGPGSFTGIRIGVSVIKGMAMALNKPCVAVSTLESMGYNYIDSDDIIVCGCMDARRNQVYNALFSVKKGVVSRICEDRAISIEDLFLELDSIKKPIVLVGDGALLCYNSKTENCTIELACASRRYQNATSVCLCAAKKILNNDTISSAELMPSYLRPSQAERERANKN